MLDRESGRPKGFGFCEFADVQMAETAIRNFNGYELRGRPLRVDSSATHGDRMDEVSKLEIIKMGTLLLSDREGMKKKMMLRI